MSLLKRLAFNKGYEPKSLGLTYLHHSVRAQSKGGKAPNQITLNYSKTKELIELWKKDKKELMKAKELITRYEQRQCALESLLKQF